MLEKNQEMERIRRPHACISKNEVMEKTDAIFFLRMTKLVKKVSSVTHKYGGSIST